MLVLVTIIKSHTFTVLLYNVNLLELSVIYKETKFGFPPHDDELSPAHLIVQSLSTSFIKLDM